MKDRLPLLRVEVLQDIYCRQNHSFVPIHASTILNHGNDKGIASGKSRRTATSETGNTNALDREREYAADLQAVYRTRDPLAVYQAVDGAAADVENVMLLPRYLDTLLFCPVVDYTSYRPFRTQPTMQERLRHLRDEFLALDCELQGRSRVPGPARA